MFMTIEQARREVSDHLLVIAKHSDLDMEKVEAMLEEIARGERDENLKPLLAL